MGKPAELKTKETTTSVEDFINSVENEQKRKDSLVLLKLFQKISKEKPKIWGSSIVGFGKVRYKSPSSGREVDWFKIGFSPRKANLTLHLVASMEAQSALLKKLGKHKSGKGCLYINKLDDVDLKVMEDLVKAAMKEK